MKKFIKAIIIALSIVSLTYIMFDCVRSWRMYKYIISNERSWKGEITRYDPNLGFAPIPDATGFETFPLGDDLPVLFDHGGFKIPVNDQSDHSQSRPLVLGLGCSFTYGSAVPAEETFPYLVGKGLGGSTINAGVSSYGLSQMLLRARELIPKYSPDLVLIQYSPWLIERSQSKFAPSLFGKVPVPYFITSGNEVMIHGPIFPALVFDLPTDEYRKSSASILDFITFSLRIGLPLFTHDDLLTAWSQVMKLFDSKSERIASEEQIVATVYQEIAELIKNTGGKGAIVIIGSEDRPFKVHQELIPSSLVEVDSNSALLHQAKLHPQLSYQQLFGHWRGNPPVPVDGHPNSFAHRIIADSILKKFTSVLGSSQ